jgi:F0F1-type ATP synthase membrane subunit c/vacuolar-type H+-ATPase subunit K
MTDGTLITALMGVTLGAGLGMGIMGVRGARKAKEKPEKSNLADR